MENNILYIFFNIYTFLLYSILQCAQLMAYQNFRLRKWHEEYDNDKVQETE